MSATALTEGSLAIASSTPDLSPSPLAFALVEALRELMVVEAARTAKVEMKAGGNYSYKYADIADVVKLTRPVLQQHGIVALTPVHAHGDGLACTVILLHSSGDRLDLGPFPFPHGRDAQATGSAVTYHRRYALVSALGMAAGDDDDGAAAKPRQAPTLTAEALARKAVGERIKTLPDDQREAVKDWLDASSLTRIPQDWNDDDLADVTAFLDGLSDDGKTESNRDGVTE